MNISIKLSRGSIRVWNLELDGDQISLHYGINGKIQESVKEFSEGKAGRNAEQEALREAYKRVMKKIEDDYEVSEGSLEELEAAYENMVEEVEAAKEAERREKEEAKEREKAERKARKEAEKAEAEADEDEEDAEADEDELDEEIA